MHEFNNYCYVLARTIDAHKENSAEFCVINWFSLSGDKLFCRFGVFMSTPPAPRSSNIQYYFLSYNL